MNQNILVFVVLFFFCQISRLPRLVISSQKEFVFQHIKEIVSRFNQYMINFNLTQICLLCDELITKGYHIHNAWPLVSMSKPFQLKYNW